MSTDVKYLTTPIAEVRIDPVRQGAGMTRDGYTKRSGAPTDRMIRLQGEMRWRRLMVWQFSNSGTLFVKVGGENLIVPWHDLPSETSHATKRGTALKMEKTMHEFKHGTLKSSSGKKVKSRKQAIAIGLSQSRRAGYAVPAKKSAHATQSLSSSVDAYFSNMRHDTEIDARGLARALHADALAVDHELERAAGRGVAVTEDGRWYAPVGCSTGRCDHDAHARRRPAHSKMLSSAVVLTERVKMPNGAGAAIHIHHGKGGYAGVLVLDSGNELPMSLGVPVPTNATEALRGAKKFLAQVYGRSN